VARVAARVVEAVAAETVEVARVVAMAAVVMVEVARGVRERRGSAVISGQQLIRGRVGVAVARVPCRRGGK
jgi:hypothetical protein